MLPISPSLSNTSSSSSSSSISSLSDSKASQSVYDYIHKRRRGYYFRRSNQSQDRQKIIQALQKRSVATLSENPIDLKDHDKIFASTWTNSSNVVVGTKENKILALDITNRHPTWINIPLIKFHDPKSTSLSKCPQRASKSMDPRMVSSTTNNRRRNKGRRHGSNSSHNEEDEGDDEENNVYMREPITPTSIRQRFGQQVQQQQGRRSPSSSPPGVVAGVMAPTAMHVQQLNKCDGVRSLSVNPSKTLLAVGLANPPVVMIYRLPDFNPMGITAVRDLHRDAVFSVQWLDDITFVTGSRDGTLGLWKCGDPTVTKNGATLVFGEGGEELQRIPRFWTSHQESGYHTSRIRDTKLTGPTTAASLSACGTVQIWDLNQRQKQRNIKLWHTRELVCMAPQQQGKGLNNRKGLLAVGSQEHVTLLDPRLSSTASAAQEFPSQDQDWGVRSLAFQDHIVTCGGGLGHLSFYDIRNKSFIPSSSMTTTTSKITTSSSSSSLSSNSSDTFCSVSSGWLDESSSIYQTYFYGQHRLMPQAIYTLEYSPDDSGKLFTAGGPIQSSLRGCYAALWC
ncbi:WD40-repeat-containing domain protein [Phascolomyces articulosus]|uniref:WD40-repeat-containing domain protein n=1 Tax=Phascolomyces articulosus TaxID=60185 RepID=A0AAD5KK06_9FUNG|nr:WD40-repeat-containing domain protein [Phascolomyces articulosus]